MILSIYEMSGIEPSGIAYFGLTSFDLVNDRLGETEIVLDKLPYVLE